MKTHEMHDWLKAGTHYRSKGNFEKALEAFAQARLALLCEMGECLTSLGQLEDGRVLFEEVLEANSADIRANAGIGVISLLAEEYGTAGTAFGNVLHLDPDNVKALCGMGMAKRASGQLEEAYRVLQEAHEKDSVHKSTLQALADVGGRLGKAAEVLPLLRKYLKRYPEDREIAIDITALEELSTAILTTPLASPSEELKNVLESFRANPDDLSVVNKLLRLLHQLGRSQEAQAVRAVFLVRNPEMASALLQS